MRRLPTYEERAKLRQAREQRRRELLAQADQVRAEVAQLARDCAAASFGPGDEPRQERVEAQLVRLEAARAALQLALQLVEQDDPEQLGDLPDRLQAALGRWKRSSEGWWEARIVHRPRLLITKDQDTGQVRISVVMMPFGPYFYRHWRQEGKQHTQYLTRQRPKDFPADQEVPELPEPAPLVPVSQLGREALVLADQLAGLHNAEADEDRRRRLRRLLKAAGRRVERRLRAEAQHHGELSVLDKSVHTIFSDASEVSPVSQVEPPALPPPSQVPLPLAEAVDQVTARQLGGDDPQAAVLRALGGSREPVAAVWRRLGWQRRALEAVINEHYDALLAEGMRLFVATASHSRVEHYITVHGVRHSHICREQRG